MRPHSLDSRPMMAGGNGAVVAGQALTTLRPFGSGSSDEDPYSVAGPGSSAGGSSGGNAVNNRSRSRDKPPKLPPRDIYGPKLWAKPGDEQESKKKGKRSGGGTFIGIILQLYF